MKMKHGIIKISGLFVCLIFLFTAVTVYADQNVTEIRNDDIEVIANYKNPTTLSLEYNQLNKDIEQVQIEFEKNIASMISDIIDENGKRYEIKEDKVDVSSSNKIDFIFKEAIPSNFIQSIIYTDGSKSEKLYLDSHYIEESAEEQELAEDLDEEGVENPVVEEELTEDSGEGNKANQEKELKENAGKGNETDPIEI